MEMQPDRRTLYGKFVARFRPATGDYRAVPVTMGELAAAEAVIGRLPESYRTFVMQFGAGEIDTPEDPTFAVAEIWAPESIVRQVREEWWAPIPAFLNGGTTVASD